MVSKNALNILKPHSFRKQLTKTLKYVS